MSVIPRPASTVVLIDEYFRVYLTKRPKTMKFLGGYYVFPGGAVEGGDQISVRMISTKKKESFNPSHYVAGARELFEEVGVFLGQADDGSPNFFKKKTKGEYRQLLLSGEISLSDILEDEGLALNLDSLQYFGHLITPKSSPIRFDTRFFLAHLPKGQSPSPDQREIDDAFWMSPEEALKAYKKGQIPMAPPTIASLQGIYEYQLGKPLKMPSIQDFIL